MCWTVEQDLERANTTIASLLQQLDHIKAEHDNVTGIPPSLLLLLLLLLSCYIYTLARSSRYLVHPREVAKNCKVK